MSQLDELKKRISFDVDKFESKGIYETVLKNLLDDAKYIALGAMYPFLEDFDGIDLPSKLNNWQLRAAVEIYKWQGNSGIKSYSELSLSWTRATDGVLPVAMMNELPPPKAGVPKRRV